jgi:glyoxylase-like metal-dependent hydrolase (beta-lactamase superfamily II)
MLPRSSKALLGAAERMGAPITRTLQPGDTVGSLEVVASPGHTPGHVSFLDRRDGTLLAGDAYSTLGGVATSARPDPGAAMDRAIAKAS